MDEVLDLFGDPVAANFGRPGRPQHVRTQENCNKVKLLLALGWSNERIAHRLHITLPTLRKHYFSELKYRAEARDRLDGRFAELVWKQVEAGNVGAMRVFQQLLEKNDLMHYGQTQRPVAAEEKPEKLGKKEQALRDAREPDRGTPLGELMARRQGATLN